MKVAKVIGNIWATRKEEKLAGLKLLLVQPLDVLTGKAERPPIVAADIIGAGVGETVLVVGGSSARSAASKLSCSPLPRYRYPPPRDPIMSTNS